MDELNCEFQFTSTGEAWYHNPKNQSGKWVNELVVHKVTSDEKGDYEFAIRWYQYGDGLPTMQIEIFDDALAAFCDLHAVFESISKMDITGFDDVKAHLRGLGFSDVTALIMPEDSVPYTIIGQIQVAQRELFTGDVDAGYMVLKRVREENEDEYARAMSILTKAYLLASQ